MEKNSYRNKILNYLSAGNNITLPMAIQLFRCYSLSQRITELRQQGIAIRKTRIKSRTGKHFMQYSLVDKQKQIE